MNFLSLCEDTSLAPSMVATTVNKPQSSGKLFFFPLCMKYITIHKLYHASGLDKK